MNKVSAMSHGFRLGLFSCFTVVLLMLAHDALGGSLDLHHRQLLEARVEDLGSRLGSSWDLHTLAHSKIHVKSRGKVRSGHIAGFGLRRVCVGLKGQAGLVLRWLDAASRAHVLFRPPFEIHARNDMGRPVMINIVLWQVEPGVLQAGVSDDDLLRLRDDLVWFESGLEDTKAMLALMELLVDFEQVHLEQAKLKDGVLRVRANAVDDRSKNIFSSLLEKHTKVLHWAPKLDMKVSSPMVSDLPEDDLPGMKMDHCPFHIAVSSAGIFTKQQFVMVSRRRDVMTGAVSGVEPTGLFISVLCRTGLSQARVQDIIVASHELSAKPKAIDAESKTRLTLAVSGMNATEALRRIAQEAKVQVIVADDVPGVLSARVRSITGSKLLSLVSWALGLKTSRVGKLVVFYSKGKAEAKVKSSLGTVSINSYHAPLREIVGILAGIEQVQECGKEQEQLLNVSIKPMDSTKLLGALLLGYGKTIKNKGEVGKLLDIGDVNKRNLPCRSNPGQSPGDLSLLAVVRSGKKSFALMAIDRKLKWLQRGDNLAKGRMLARIHDKRVVLRDSSGQTVQVFLGPYQGLGDPLVSAGPSRQGLSDLRLIGTINLPGSFTVALVRSSAGDVFTMLKGQGIGRRCGKITSIASDRIRVRLACPSGYEPPWAMLYMHKSK